MIGRIKSKQISLQQTNLSNCKDVFYLLKIQQCLGCGSVRLWFPGSGSTDPDPSEGVKYQPKTQKIFLTPKPKIRTFEKKRL